MRAILFLASVGVLLTAVSCGGGGAKSPETLGTISGTISDINGKPVRNATVSAEGSVTQSNSLGSYVLQGVKQGSITVNVTATQDGLTYLGTNVIHLDGQQLAKSLNIAVVRSNQIGLIFGTVRDRSGNPLVNARVFAVYNTLSSNATNTDENGNYAMNGLAAGFQYFVTATGQYYVADDANFTLAAGENRRIDFVLGDAGDVALNPPANLGAVVWTSPREATRKPGTDSTIDIARKLYDKKDRGQDASKIVSKTVRSRDSGGGNWIETDLFWDLVNSTNLLGYGVYRALNPAGTNADATFLYDPLAVFFADYDPLLHENQQYYYFMTSLSTTYPTGVSSESRFSNSTSVVPIGDLKLLGTNTPLRFNWIAASGATSYVVYLFDTYPSVDARQIWDNEAAPIGGTTIAYSGPGLTLNKTYYYIILGLANGGSSRTVSPVGSFVFHG